MHFGKTMEQTVKEDWRVYSVNYKLLKKKLRSQGDIASVSKTVLDSTSQSKSGTGSGTDSTSMLQTHSISSSSSMKGEKVDCNTNSTTDPLHKKSSKEQQQQRQRQRHEVTTKVLSEDDQLKAAYYPSFWEIFAQSLLVIETFHRQKMDWALARLKHSESSVERLRQRAVVRSSSRNSLVSLNKPSPISARSHSDKGSINSLRHVRDALDAFANEIDTLLEFYELNHTAVSKILKKYDKRTGSRVRNTKLEELRGTYPFLSSKRRSDKELAAAGPRLPSRTKRGVVDVEGYRDRIEEIRKQVRKLEALRNCGWEGGGITPRARKFEAMLEKARSIVDGVERDSPFFRQHEQRNNPTFQASEIVRGDILGEGEFGTVREIRSFQNVKELCPICFLHRQSSQNIPILISPNIGIQSMSLMTGESTSEKAGRVAPPTTRRPLTPQPCVEISVATDTNVSTLGPLSPSSLHTNADNKTGTLGAPSTCPIASRRHSKHDPDAFVLPDDDSLRDHSSLDEESFQNDHQEEEEEEVANRGFMAHHCQRDGQARYAVKHVKEGLTGERRVESAIDLAIEAKFLSAIGHPNIIRLRGMGGASPGHPDHFIILDRLYGTLGDKLQYWRAEKEKHRGFMGWKKKSSPVLKMMWGERLLIMYDIAQGMRYLHENNMMYRDLKPENIGFDIRSNVKIFDFGLVKELKPKHRVPHDPESYHASGRTGTRRYMAPEVTLCKPYGKPVDVYSYSVLFHQTMTLTTPYPYDDHETHASKVVQGRVRPKIPSSWPTLIALTLRDGWCHEPRGRPTFGGFSDMLEGELGLNIGKSPGGKERGQDLLNESDRSHRLMLASPKRGKV